MVSQFTGGFNPPPSAFVPIPAGDFRHRVTLQQRVVTLTASGSSAPDEWEEIATLWAKIEIAKMSAYRITYEIIASQFAPTMFPAVTIRYRPGILTGMRFVTEGGDIYEIIIPPADIDGRHAYLACACRDIQQGVTRGNIEQEGSVA